MYASTEAEVQHVRSSKDLPGMAGFQQELKQQMRRKRGSNGSTLKIPSGNRNPPVSPASLAMSTM